MKTTENGGPRSGTAIHAHLGLQADPVKPGSAQVRRLCRLFLDRNEVNGRIFAASVNLEIELEPVALVDACKARTFDSADVDEGIRLAVIARDKAKALHAVEELDSADRLVACKLAMRGLALGGHGDHVTHDLKVRSAHLPAAIDEIEGKLLPFGKAFEARTLNRADVNEHILTAVFTLDEAEALVGVEEFHDALAGTHDLRRHAATAATCTASAAATKAATAAAARTATETTAAVASTEATAAAIIAEAAAITVETTTTKATRVRRRLIVSETTARERIEPFFTETIALVTTATAPTFIITHKPKRTLRLALPSIAPACGRTIAGRSDR